MKVQHVPINREEPARHVQRPRQGTVRGRDHAPRAAAELVAKVLGGWDVHSGILEDILNGVEPRPFWATHEKVAPEYAALAQ